jgi:hypothetical protein
MIFSWDDGDVGLFKTGYSIFSSADEELSSSAGGGIKFW